MSIELFLLVNLFADTALICAVTRTLGCFAWRRTLTAGGLCAAYAALAAARPVWGSPVVQLALLAAISALLAGRFCLRAARIALLLPGAALVSGGLWLLNVSFPSGPAIALPCAGSGALLIWAMLSAQHPLRDGWQVRVALRVGVRTVRFEALIDTGNRLREPISGLPVLIAEAPLLEGVLPESGWRALRFGALGSDGRLACFKPSAFWIERGRRRQRAPDVWIAVAQSPLPGLARALAPGEFAAYP